MNQIAELRTQVVTRGRRLKFTPERIQQIKNLVERGKSSGEIAELVGVTVGSLRVTCSRLGISLRQPRFKTGTGPLRRNGSALLQSTELPLAQDEPVPGDEQATWSRSQLMLMDRRFVERLARALRTGGESAAAATATTNARRDRRPRWQ